MAGGEAKKNMFYSHNLLSRKGSLGTIWIAAHCFNKLKRKQIEQTNVCSSVANFKKRTKDEPLSLVSMTTARPVTIAMHSITMGRTVAIDIKDDDKILRDEVPVVTYRILAYLLLGNVRIYSKKVEYLFNDCRNALSKIYHFASNKKCNPPIGVMLAPESSIVVPARFELDTFDLELIENESGDHISPDEDITLNQKAEGSGLHSFDLDDASHIKGFSSGQTGVKDMFLPFSMTDDVIASTSHDLRDLEASIEKICNDIFSGEECLPPMLFDEAEEEVDPERTFREDHQTDGDEIESPHCEIMLEDDEEPEGRFNLFDEWHQELTKFSEMTSLENENIEMTSQKDPVDLSIDVTPELKVLNTTGVPMPKILSAITPATREGMNKRKCIYDKKTIITAKVYRKGLDDSRHLIRRHRTRHAAAQWFTANQMASLPQSLWSPLIPCISINFKQKNPEQIETVETRTKFDELGIQTIDRPHKEEGIAPSTPVTHSILLRYNDIHGVSNSERVAPASSFETIEKDLSPDDDEESDVSLISEELNSCEGDSQEKDNNWSAKSSAVASYLHKNFLTRKQRGEDEIVNLSRASDGKTKKESASLFYELLVLKTGGFVEVKQDHAYADISFIETAKLKEACEADET